MKALSADGWRILPCFAVLCSGLAWLAASHLEIRYGLLRVVKIMIYNRDRSR